MKIFTCVFLIGETLTNYDKDASLHPLEGGCQDKSCGNAHLDADGYALPVPPNSSQLGTGGAPNRNPTRLEYGQISGKGMSELEGKLHEYCAKSCHLRMMELRTTSFRGKQICLGL